MADADSMPENWAPIPGYVGLYEVSSHGRIRSLDRLVKGPRVIRQVAGRMLVPGKTEDGYLKVNLCRAGKATTMRVNRLVLIAFAGPAPADKPMACHEDNDRSNNRASNLRWDSNSGNQRDRKRNGTAHLTGKPFMGRSRAAQVKQMVEGGSSMRETAQTFGISRAHVGNIVAGRNWASE